MIWKSFSLFVFRFLHSVHELHINKFTLFTCFPWAMSWNFLTFARRRFYLRQRAMERDDEQHNSNMNMICYRERTLCLRLPQDTWNHNFLRDLPMWTLSSTSRWLVETGYKELLKLCERNLESRAKIWKIKMSTFIISTFFPHPKPHFLPFQGIWRIVCVYKKWRIFRKFKWQFALLRLLISSYHSPTFTSQAPCHEPWTIKCHHNKKNYVSCVIKNVQFLFAMKYDETSKHKRPTRYVCSKWKDTTSGISRM